MSCNDAAVWNKNSIAVDKCNFLSIITYIYRFDWVARVNSTANQYHYDSLIISFPQNCSNIKKNFLVDQIPRFHHYLFNIRVASVWVILASFYLLATSCTISVYGIDCQTKWCSGFNGKKFNLIVGKVIISLSLWDV